MHCFPLHAFPFSALLPKLYFIQITGRWFWFRPLKGIRHDLKTILMVTPGKRTYWLEIRDADKYIKRHRWDRPIRKDFIKNGDRAEMDRPSQGVTPSKRSFPCRQTIGCCRRACGQEALWISCSCLSSKVVSPWGREVKYTSIGSQPISVTFSLCTVWVLFRRGRNSSLVAVRGRKYKYYFWHRNTTVTTQVREAQSIERMQKKWKFHFWC